MLTVRNLHISIGAIDILRHITLDIVGGEMVGLVGRNGAGKTTTLRGIMGVLSAKEGEVLLEGEDITRFPADKRAALGIGYMPEDRRLVPQLTVEENILLPVWAVKRLDPTERLERAYALLPELKNMRHRKPLLLSGGQQKLVALARAVAAGTRLLLLDEPFEGVAPALALRLADVIRELHHEKLAMLVAQSEVNHFAHHLHRQYVIERGEIVRAV